jgi:5-methylcytosine-specific restriction endonuclease McrA
LIGNKLVEGDEGKEEKKYKCKKCGKGFNKPQSMYRHMGKYCKLRLVDAEINLQTRQAVHDIKEELKKAVREELEVEVKAEVREAMRKEVQERINALGAGEVQTARTKTGTGVRKGIPCALRNAVWVVYIGSKTGESVCFCCGVESISRSNYECGHVQSRAKGGQAKLDNLRPICTCCNKSMGTKNMFEFAQECGFTSCKIMPDNRQLRNQADSLEMTDELCEELYPIER